MYLEIETQVLKKFGLSIEDLGLLVFCTNNPISLANAKGNKIIKKLWLYGFLDRKKHHYLVNKDKLFRIIISMKDGAKEIKERAAALAPLLIEIFPKGKKPGTNQYWRGNRVEVTNKLQKFFSMFGNEYTNEQIIEATTKYVNSFNGNYSFMRVLKYFIWKNVLRIGESVNNIEEVSDLLTFLDNEGQENEITTDWATELR